MKKFRPNREITLKPLFFIVLILVLTFHLVYCTYGQTTKIRVVDPETGGTDFKFYTNSTFVETRFNTTVVVSDVADLYAFQICLRYDSSLIEPTRAWMPKDDTEYVFHTKNALSTGPYFYQDDPIYGTSILVGSTLLGDINGFTGTGLLTIIEFKITDGPNVGEAVFCDLNITNEYTFLLKRYGLEIQASETNGYYEYKWAAPLTYLVAEPRIYKASKLESFNITIGLNNTFTDQRLVYVNFELSYNSALLNVTQVIEGNFFTGFGDTIFNYTMGSGVVIVESTLVNYTSFPEGDGPIAIVTFQGVYQDVVEHFTPLKFVSSQFLNDNGEAITIIPMDSTYEIGGIATVEITLNLHSDNWVKSDGRYYVIEGAEVVINGSITPSKEGINVTIYCRVGQFEKWRTNTTTDSEGHYRYVWTTNQTDLRGLTLEFQTRWEVGLEIIAESEVWSSLEITRKEQSEITITINPETIVVGGSATVKGSISLRLPANVTIYYRLENETNGWIELATVRTDNNGRYNYQWTVQKIATYKVKASWPGDLPLIEGDESDEVSLKVVETIPIDVLAYLPYVLAGVIIIIVVVVLYLKKFRKP